MQIKCGECRRFKLAKCVEQKENVDELANFMHIHFERCLHDDLFA